MSDLIYARNNSLNQDFCNFVIERFEDYIDHHIEGLSGGSVNPNIKKSVDLMFVDHLGDSSWKDIYNYLTEELLLSLVEYNRKYPWLWRSTNDFSSELSLVRSVQNRFTASSNGNYHMQIQKYTGDDGYYAWHYENYIEDEKMNQRQMAFMWYLNNVEEGGETEFKFQNIKIKPEVGKNVIFPAFWTHTHRGNPCSLGQKKYIITGWIENNSKKENFFNELHKDFFI